MKIAKPINISIEIFLYLAILLVSFSDSVEETVFGYVDGFLVLGGFFFFIVLISIRAVKSDRYDRALTSTALFGFIVGFILWSLFVLVESSGEGLSIGISTIIYIISTGMFVAIISVLTCYLVVRLLRVMRIL